MSYRRFNLIYRFLHFSDNETFVTETHECPKLSKIWPVLKYLTIHFKEVVTPDRDVTIVESLMLFKERLGSKQYMPLKRSRFGIKCYMLSESKSGYVWSLIIYTGKGTLFDEKYKHMCMSSQVVMTLMGPLLNKGHCLTTDNFYSSPELADIPIQSLTDIYGTLKPRRKDVPKELLSKKIDKGQMIAYQRGSVCVMKWMDNKSVCLISTIHNPKMVQVQSHKNEIRRKPKAVMEYNNTMGGVDRLDQHLTNYPLIKKRGKKTKLHWCAKIKDEVEKLAYQLNEEAERTERPIKRLNKVMYGSTCADMQVDVMEECLSSIKHVVGTTSGCFYPRSNHWEKLEEGRSVTSVAAEFGIAHSIVSRLWKQFQTTGTAIRGFSSGHPRGTTPADDRYIVLQARRNRWQTAGEIARHKTQATGRPISRFTVARRLHGDGLFARRPVRCVPLTPAHWRRRSLWCREHRNWRDNEWGRVLFTDESIFSLSSDSHRILIWRAGKPQSSLEHH
ncbi:piggyBac transposable element-derived protein 4 [Trichonephila clavipes]|nr:piggyBac transposable element-derived protein 4 [Trichonephila clavipes]